MKGDASKTINPKTSADLIKKSISQLDKAGLTGITPTDLQMISALRKDNEWGSIRWKSDTAPEASSELYGGKEYASVVEKNADGSVILSRTFLVDSSNPNIAIPHLDDGYPLVYAYVSKGEAEGGTVVQVGNEREEAIKSKIKELLKSPPFDSWKGLTMDCDNFRLPPGYMRFVVRWSNPKYSMYETDMIELLDEIGKKFPPKPAELPLRSGKTHNAGDGIVAQGYADGKNVYADRYPGPQATQI
jgi:hypothetical protein